jgi:exodeoxyribonuclease V gamma subunit
MEAQSLTQRFFGGGVQFATLMPMRSIPFRIVCLLGMNDGDYPRRMEPRDFDLMARIARAGDRSRREDDRYLFLEALLCARERLYISWQGRRATDNADLPPSVVVGQLLEDLATRYTPPCKEQLQPLQPFSRQYFEAGSPFTTYDADWQRQHTDAADAVPAVASFMATPVATLTAAELERLLRQPVEVYWRSHLNVQLEDPAAATSDEEPFELDKLQSYQAMEGLLGNLPRRTGEQALEVLRLSGRLPIAAQGRRLGRELLGKSEATWHGAQSWLERYGQVLAPLSLDLSVGAVQLTGQLDGLRGGEEGLLQLLLRPGAVLHTIDYPETPRYHVLLGAWVRHVLACAQGESLRTVVVGVDAAVELAPLAALAAQRLLANWVEVYAVAWQKPLPLAPKSALAYLTAGSDHAAAREVARKIFECKFNSPGEQALSPYLRRSFLTFDDVAEGLGPWGRRLYGELVTHAQRVLPP